MRSGYNGTGVAIASGYILKSDGTNVDGVALATAATDAIAGVSIEILDIAKHRSYQRAGKVAVYAGDTVTIGQSVVADATSRAVPAASASAANFQNILGIAQTGGAVGELIEVELAIGSKAYVAASTVADRTALKAIAAASRYEGMQVMVQSDYSTWVFDSSSTLTDDTALELVQEPAAGTGAWIRADKSFTMSIPCSYANTDGEAIETIPAGFVVRLAAHPYLEVGTAWTGGSSSAIGFSTNISGYEAGGDFLGTASGMLAAALGAGVINSTIGDELGDITGLNAMLFVATSEIQFDRVASAFTAGTGNLRVPVIVSYAP
jgi:hypothetical protein